MLNHHATNQVAAEHEVKALMKQSRDLTLFFFGGGEMRQVLFCLRHRLTPGDLVSLFPEGMRHGNNHRMDDTAGANQD